MNLKKIQLAVYEGLGKASSEFTLSEISRFSKASMEHVASMVPHGDVPEILKTAGVTDSGTPSADYGLNSFDSAEAYIKPDDCLEVVGVRVDTTDYDAVTHPLPVYTEARYVKPSEYFHRMSDDGSGQSERLYTVIGNDILVNFKRGTGYPTSPYPLYGALITYKKRPSYKISSFADPTGIICNGAVDGSYYKRLHGGIGSDAATYGLGSNYLIAILPRGVDDSAGTLGNLWTYVPTPITWATMIAGVAPIDPTPYIGGTVTVIPTAFNEGDTSSGVTFNESLTIHRIVDAFDLNVPWDRSDPDENNWVWADVACVLVDSSSGNNPNLNANFNMVISSSTTTTPLLNDYDTYLDEKWTQAIISHALSSLWLKVGDVNRSQLLNAKFTELVQLNGFRIGGSQ